MTPFDPAAWKPATARSRLCVDTSGLFAYFYPADAHHEDARAFFEWLHRQDATPWRLFVSDYVIDECCSLLARKASPRTAIDALEDIRHSDALPIVRVPEEAFERAMETFADYDHQAIPFTDHVVSAHAFARESPVYTFDSTDSGLLGNELIPRWQGSE